MPNLDLLIADCLDAIEDTEQALNGFILFNDSSKVSADSKAEAQEDIAALQKRLQVLTNLRDAAKAALADAVFNPPVLTAKQSVIDELKALLGNGVIATGLLQPPVVLPVEVGDEQTA